MKSAWKVCAILFLATGLVVGQTSTEPKAKKAKPAAATITAFMPQIHSLLDASGKIKDAELLERLKSQADGFAGFVEKLKGVKLRAEK